jgi:hypothetical protein
VKILSEDFNANVEREKIFGYKKDEVTGGWRKSHSEELRNFYSSPHVIKMIKSKRMRLVDYVACMGTMRNVYEVLAAKPEGKTPL